MENLFTTYFVKIKVFILKYYQKIYIKYMEEKIDNFV